jgi:hypothetical protein
MSEINSEYDELSRQTVERAEEIWEQWGLQADDHSEKALDDYLVIRQIIAQGGDNPILKRLEALDPGDSIEESPLDHLSVEEKLVQVLLIETPEEEHSQEAAESVKALTNLGLSRRIAHQALFNHQSQRSDLRALGQVAEWINQQWTDASYVQSIQTLYEGWEMDDWAWLLVTGQEEHILVHTNHGNPYQASTELLIEKESLYQKGLLSVMQALEKLGPSEQAKG